MVDDALGGAAADEFVEGGFAVEGSGGAVDYGDGDGVAGVGAGGDGGAVVHGEDDAIGFAAGFEGLPYGEDDVGLEVLDGLFF